MKVQSVWVKRAVDEGKPTPDLFEIRETTIEEKDVPEGGILMDILVMSVDPYLRFHIAPGASPELDKEGGMLMRGYVAGKVIMSKSPDWKVGDFFGANSAFSSKLIFSKEQLKPGDIWNLTGHVTEEDIEKGIGVLGMPGCTAYYGIIDILKPKKGETIFISAASGAVGSLVAQMAKMHGAKLAIGSCGGETKCDVIKEKFSYDSAIDYKKIADTEHLTQTLRDIAPEGIDMYFENVGGMHFEAAFNCLNPDGRIAVCGAISEYNSKETPSIKLPLTRMIFSQLRIQGFVVFEYMSGQRGDGKWVEEIGAWLKEGKLKSQETSVKGIESWPEAFCSLFSGTTHIGKLAVKL